MTNPAAITSLDACITQLLAHATTAAAALAAPITDVARGMAIPAGRCVRVWYGGEADPSAVMGLPRAVSSELIGEVVHITTFWPMQGASGTSIAATVDQDVHTMKDQLRSLILSHSTLNGNCIDLDLDYMTADAYELTDGTQWRTLEATVTLAYSEYSTSA